MKKFLAYKGPLEAYVAAFLAEHKGSIYDPVQYILELGGKRLRPALTLGAAEAYDTAAPEVMHLAAAIEMFHNFTLLHDDIMDEADLRRGKETVHLKWNKDQAILSGDIMFAMGYELLLQKETQNQSEILKLFTRTAKEVCEGQQRDMEFEKRTEVTAEEYLEMIRLKTSVLLGAAAAIGALAAGVSEDRVKHMYAFGEQLGLAFQIQDDLLDAFSPNAEMGKVPGGDILQNKKTLLYIYALNQSNVAQRKELLSHYAIKGGSSEKINAVREVFIASGALEQVKNVQIEFLEKAEKSLAAAAVPSDWHAEFLSMLSFQTERIK